MTDAPERTPLERYNCLRGDAMVYADDGEFADYADYAALEQERDVALTAYNNVWDCNETLRAEVERLQAEIRQKADYIESSGPGCKCYEPEIHAPCWKCRVVVSLRALTRPEGER